MDHLALNGPLLFNGNHEYSINLFIHLFIYFTFYLAFFF